MKKEDNFLPCRIAISHIKGYSLAVQCLVHEDSERIIGVAKKGDIKGVQGIIPPSFIQHIKDKEIKHIKDIFVRCDNQQNPLNDESGVFLDISSYIYHIPGEEMKIEYVKNIQQEIESDMDKCKNNPYYFFTNYLTVDGKKATTHLSESEFNEMFEKAMGL